jgi:glycosyltransferase involved in cell wall biosynthesis
VKVLFLIRDLDFRSGPKQLSLLAPALPRARFEICVGMLTGNGPFGAPLRASGVRVEALGWNRLVDVRPFWQLRRLLRSFRPDLIHCWDLSALRALALAGDRPRSKIMVTLPSGESGRSLREFGSIWRLNRWLLGQTDQLAVQFAADYDCWRRNGLAGDRLAVIPPGVAPFRERGVDRSETCRALELPDSARWLLCVGRLESHKGFRDAIWTFNILGFLFPDHRLVFIGQGPDRDRLERFTKIVDAERFLLKAAEADTGAILAHADVIWVPSRRPTGLNVALEAMAAGKPVIASNHPALAEIVVDGETGLLVPPGDKMRLARQTRLLLENADLRRRFGEAGRRRAESQFSQPRLVKQYAELYESIVGGRQMTLPKTSDLLERRVG